MKINILGVNIDKINKAEALEKIEKWIWNPGKHYIVTPNLEFILAAYEDSQFKQVLNQADLAIPDSSSLGFSYWLLKRNRLLRFFLWPLFFIPLKQVIQFDRVSGIDLMEGLCKLAAEKGFVVGLLGGGKEVAQKTAECLRKKYPKLKIVFADSGGHVDKDGRSDDSQKLLPCDLLFVAFGHIKQEKWIANNLDKIPVKVAMGVGGSFDYLSGNVSRAPEWVRSLGFEWLFRLIIQPWRIKRQLRLLKYLGLVLLR